MHEVVVSETARLLPTTASISTAKWKPPSALAMDHRPRLEKHCQLTEN
jgi:hypothetical protein